MMHEGLTTQIIQPAEYKEPADIFKKTMKEKVLDNK